MMIPPRLLFVVSLSGLLSGCILSPSEKKHPVPWDTTFSVGAVQFPNDTVYNHANLTLTTNARMGKFLKKCETRKTVRIGFIGGSITEGAVTTSNAFRYSSLLSSYVKHAYPNLTSVVEINAGIGSTDSRYGASRAAEDLLAASPDLIVIEYAVNDFIGDTVAIRATIEGLVRQALLYAPDVPVMMLFTTKAEGQNVQGLHAEIGAHYGLAMISYRDAIWPLLESGGITWGDVFYHDPHPNNNGHRIAAHLLYTYLKKAAGQPQAGVSPVPAPLYTDLYQYAGVLTTEDTTVQAGRVGWDVVTGNKNRVGYRTSGTGPSTLTLTTRKRELTLGIHMHATDTSSVRVVLEGGGLDTVLNDYYPFEHTRLIRVFLSDTVKTRTVRVEHTGTKAFALDYVLYAGRPE